MDAFTILGLPASFALSEGDLRQKYFALSRQLHPDVNSDLAAVQQSAALNSAYQTLLDPVARAGVLLARAGHPPDDRGCYDTALLEEISALRERVEAGEQAAVWQQVTERAASTTAALAKAFADADYAGASILRMRLLYYRKVLADIESLPHAAKH